MRGLLRRRRRIAVPGRLIAIATVLAVLAVAAPAHAGPRDEVAHAARITSPLGRTGLDGRIRIVARVTAPEKAPVPTVRVYVNGELLATDSDGAPSGVSHVGALSIAAGARLDLRDNKLLTTTAAGNFNGTAYTGVQGEVQRAYNFGGWDGNGLTTSMPDAAGGITTLGVATGEQIRGLGATDTDVWNGVTIQGSDTVVMYTYAGDANLDGQVDAGDYGILDFFVQIPFASGYANGDYNYDGFIDAADYGTIDNSIQFQGPPIATSGSAASAGPSGVTAVPEPASLSVIALGAARLLGRRRRRRTRDRA